MELLKNMFAVFLLVMSVKRVVEHIFCLVECRAECSDTLPVCLCLREPCRLVAVFVLMLLTSLMRRSMSEP